MLYLTAIAALQLFAIAFLVWDKARDRAAGERERATMRAEAQREREGLLREAWQRIQAPEVAVMQHQIQGPVVMPQHVPMDDDDAYHESKEELAERMMREDLSVAG